MDKLSFIALNIFFNSLLAFFTTYLLVEALLFVCRIKQGRIAAWLRMIPIVKLPCDFFLYDFSRWSYLQGVNPFCCEEGTRTIKVIFGWLLPSSDWLWIPFFNRIELTTPGDLTFTLPDLLGYLMHPYLLIAFTSVFASLSITLIIKKIAHYSHRQNTLRDVAANAMPAKVELSNKALSSVVAKQKCAIAYSTDGLASPGVVGLVHPTIYIPHHLVCRLSTNEVEAIVAHEIEHVRHRDTLIRFAIDLIASFFWWVPTRSLYKKIEEGQETGCDLSCKKYGIEPLDLASAIVLATKGMTARSTLGQVSHLAAGQTLKRIQTLLQPEQNTSRTITFIFVALAVAVALTNILFGRFWIF